MIRLIAPWWPMIRAELAERGGVGALYCSRMPVM